jgi:hypothetical protein
VRQRSRQLKTANRRTEAWLLAIPHWKSPYHNGQHVRARRTSRTSSRLTNTSLRSAPTTPAWRCLSCKCRCQRIVGAAIKQHVPMTPAPIARAVASSHGVEPKHWFPARTCNFAHQDAQPRSTANIHSGGLTARQQVGQSVPKLRKAGDNPSNRRQQGTKPVRFSNGQQLT